MDEKVIHAHKTILCCASDLFKRIFLDDDISAYVPPETPAAAEVEEDEPKQSSDEKILTEHPEVFCCPITQDLMKDPVIGKPPAIAVIALTYGSQPRMDTLMKELISQNGLKNTALAP